MPIQLRWYPEMERVLHWSFTGKWTWEAFFDTFAQELKMVSALDGQRWDIIGEFVDHSTIPRSPGPIDHVIRTLEEGKRHNLGIVMVATESAFIRGMIDIAVGLHPLYRETIRACPNVEAAVAAIRESRAMAG